MPRTGGSHCPGPAGHISDTGQDAGGHLGHYSFKWATTFPSETEVKVSLSLNELSIPSWSLSSRVRSAFTPLWFAEDDQSGTV